MIVTATTLDDVRIECVGEARAVRCPGAVWVHFRDSQRELLGVCEAILEAGYALGMHHSELVAAVKKARGEL